MNSDLLTILEAEIRDPASRCRVAFAIGLADAMHRHEAVKTAELMLQAGRRRNEICPALMARYGVSRSTAYRFIHAALNERSNKGGE